MKYLLLILFVTGCYDKKDAVRDVLSAGGVNPVRCVVMSSGEGAREAFVCVDGANYTFACDSDGCVKTGSVGK